MSSVLASLGPGVIFARDFKIVRALAEGGMGAVFVAEQLSSGKLRALKVLNPDVMSDEANREQFALEARVGAQIASGHVVEVIAAGIDDDTGVPYLAMELLEGEDLADLLHRRGRLPAHEVLEIFEQLGDALAAAHRAGVVHRDLKPRNIFVARSRLRGMPFVVKVLDFGISKLITHNTTSVTVTRQIGSPLFMAPEQARSGSKLRRSTDVWPLGLLAFLLLTGRHYWKAVSREGVNLNELLMDIAVNPLDTPSQRVTDLGLPPDLLPPGFDAWFFRCVDRDPERRFVEAGEAVEALRGVLLGRHAAMLESEPTVVRTLPTPAPSPFAVPPSIRGATPISQPVGFPATGPIPSVETQPASNTLAIGPPPAGPTGPVKRAWREWRVAVVAGVALLGGLAVFVTSRSGHDATPTGAVALHFTGLPSGAVVRVGAQAFAGGEALVPRSAAPTTVRVEAPGRRTVVFSLVPDHDQRLVVPELAAEAVVDAGNPSPARVAAAVAPVVGLPSPLADAGSQAPESAPDGAAAHAPRPRLAMGRLTVGADPPRCDVSVDGRPVGRSPVFNRVLPAGDHRVRCDRPGGHPAVRIAHVAPNRETEIIFPGE